MFSLYFATPFTNDAMSLFEKCMFFFLKCVDAKLSKSSCKMIIYLRCGEVHFYFHIILLHGRRDTFLISRWGKGEGGSVNTPKWSIPMYYVLQFTLFCLFFFVGQLIALFKGGAFSFPSPFHQENADF